MKVSMVTMNIEIGNCQKNVNKMLMYIEKARCENVDLIIFPQNAVSGYLLYEQWMDDTWCSYVDSFNDILIQESYDIAIVWGNIRYRNKRRFQAAFFAYEGKTHMRVKKNEKLAYIQDDLYFEESQINSAIQYKGYVMALNFKDDRQIADININIDSYMYDVSYQRNIRGTQLYVNASGIQYNRTNVHVLDGKCMYMQDGKCLYASSSLCKEYHIVTLHQQSNISNTGTLYEMICTSLRLFDEQVGKDKQWILPITDNIGSILSAYIFVNAISNKKLIGIILDDNCPISFYEQLGITLIKIGEDIVNKKAIYDKLILEYEDCIIIDTNSKVDRVLKNNPYIECFYTVCSIIGDLTKKEVNSLLDMISILPKDDFKYVSEDINDAFIECLCQPTLLPMFFKTYQTQAHNLMQSYQKHRLRYERNVYVLCMHHRVIDSNHLLPTFTYDYLIEKKDLSY